MARPDRIGKLYRHKWHRKLLFPDRLRRILQKPQTFLPKLVKEGMTAADIGCGTGFYAVELARIVGPAGRVFAVDLQPEMLRLAEKRARKAGFAERIDFIHCSKDKIALPVKVDFALTMWVVHEAADRLNFLRQIESVLKPGGRYLLCEPKKIVSNDLFAKICSQAESAGLEKTSVPEVGLSYAALFRKPD
jgi:ubiquinone/menaquinone biosynthesis C-methylase UbiE